MIQDELLPVERDVPAIVACIESGMLEPLTIRMVDSLRRFGGRFAHAEVLVVRARLGPPLAQSTRRSLADLDATFLDVRPVSPYPWHHYFNKVFALLAAEEACAAPVLSWLDSDILVLAAPEELVLPEDCDFAACAPDNGVVGSTGPESVHDGLWARAAASQGLRLDDLPWLQTGDGRRIRYYWNSGVFSYRRRTGFARAYLDSCTRYLAERVPGSHAEAHFMDQVVLGLTALRLHMRWRALPHSHNFALLSSNPDRYVSGELPGVRLLHYHDSMSPGPWPSLLMSLKNTHPPVHDWLSRLGPAVDPASAMSRSVRAILRAWRGIGRRRYYRAGGFSKSS